MVKHLFSQVVNRVLDSLDQWRLRVAWLDLQLLCQQLIVPGPTAATSGTGPSPLEMNQLLDVVAKAVVDVFELREEKTNSCLFSVGFIILKYNYNPHSVVKVNYMCMQIFSISAWSERVMLYLQCAELSEVFKMKKLVKSCLWKYVITPWNMLPRDNV